MCKFFSVVSDPIDDKILFFDAETRKKLSESNPKNYEYDSHTSIADYFGYTGAGEDKLNKYEYCPFTKSFIIDQINTKNDSGKIKEFCENYDFTTIFETGLFSLNLSGCDLKGITLPQSVGEWLNLSGCDLKGITLPQSVGGSLYLSGCDLKGITLPQSVGGWLDLSGCDLKGITLPQSVGGSLYLSGCDLKGITLPQSVGGWLDLSGCDLKGITLPQSVSEWLDLSGCDIPDDLNLDNYDVIK